MTAVAAPTAGSLPVDEDSRVERVLTLTAAAVGIGLADLLVSIANARARDSLPGVEVIYWAGIVFLFASPTLAAVRMRRDRDALVGLVLLLASGLFLVRVVTSPTRLATIDELQTLRNFTDLLRSHHLFAVNPIVGSYSRFPGSQIVVVALHELTGLSLSTSGKLLIGVEHLVLCLALFRLVEALTGSSFAALLAVVVYACNPNYLYFDSETAYEAFTLPLAVVSLSLLAVAARASPRNRRTLVAVATLVGATVCVSHHITSYWLGITLVGWTAVGLVRRRRGVLSGPDFVPWLPAFVVTSFAILWFALMAHAQLVHELGPVVSGSLHAVSSVLHGVTTIKKPFSTGSTSSAVNDPLILRIDAFASVAVAMVLLAGGLLTLRRRFARQAPSVVLLALGLLYPVGLALRITQASTETSSRTSEFVFIGIAVGVALQATLHGVSDSPAEPLPRRRHAAGRGIAARASYVGLGLGTLAIIATGGIVTGQPAYDRTAGTFLVNGDERSVGPLGEQTAQWASTHWSAGTTFTADRINAILIAGLGDFTPQSGSIHGDQVEDLYDSPTFDDESQGIIQGDKIRFIVVDQRLAEVTSATSPYVLKMGNDGAKRTVSTLPSAYLDKFADVPELSRVYDDGVIRIYDASNLLS